MITPRHALAAAVAAVALVSGGTAAAFASSTGPTSVDGAEAVRTVAIDAADLLAEEADLISLSRSRSGISAAELSTVRAQLRSVDGRGQALLVQLRGLGVQLTPAIETTLDRLPETDGKAGPSNVTVFPLPVVYDAAIDDLGRIAAIPAAVAPVGDGSSGPSYALLIVAAISLFVLGVAALTNTLWRRPDSEVLEAMAWSDGLTGLANRRSLDRDLVSGDRDGGPTGVIMIDVDHFKAVNDAFGHQVGDDILRRLGTLLAHHVRVDDVVYRYGGEEFCVLLPNANGDETRRVAERLVHAARTVNLPNGANITVSVGVARTAGAEISEAVEHADQALYRAKRQGRDQAVFADDAELVAN